MERVGTLIDKLKEQFIQEAENADLLATTQLLLAELQLQQKSQISKISSNTRSKKDDLTGWLFDFAEEIKNTETVSAVPDNELLSKSIFLPEVSDLIIEGQTTKLPVKEVFELNDILHEGLPSLNEQLKPNNIALSDSFHKEAITDLNKAIVLNDRYVFINELFRGDEVMYERSLKTINGFNTLLEAQSWIQRELKVKLGWNESSVIVAQFDQIVNRRFS